MTSINPRCPNNQSNNVWSIWFSDFSFQPLDLPFPLHPFHACSALGWPRCCLSHGKARCNGMILASRACSHVASAWRWNLFSIQHVGVLIGIIPWAPVIKPPNEAGSYSTSQDVYGSVLAIQQVEIIKPSKMCNLNELSAIDLLLSSAHFCSSGVCQTSQFVPFLPWGATMQPEKSRKLDLVLRRLYCLGAPKARVGSPLFSSGQHKPIWLYYMMCLVLSANPFIKTLTTPALLFPLQLLMGCVLMLALNQDVEIFRRPAWSFEVPPLQCWHKNND